MIRWSRDLGMRFGERPDNLVRRAARLDALIQLPGQSWWEVDGLGEIDLPPTCDLLDRGVGFDGDCCASTLPERRVRPTRFPLVALPMRSQVVQEIGANRFLVGLERPPIRKECVRRHQRALRATPHGVRNAWRRERVMGRRRIADRNPAVAPDPTETGGDGRERPWPPEERDAVEPCSGERHLTEEG